jgi:hypothetical protein
MEEDQKLSKLSLWLKNSLQQSIENDKDPINKLLSNFKEIEEIKELAQDEDINIIFQLLYLNIKNVHKILDDEQQFYSIDENKEFNYSELFHLSLLIEDEPETVNYKFPIIFIRRVNEYKEDYNEGKNINKIKKILISKIILVLINNFQGEEEYNEKENGEEINRIKEENENYIEDNVFLFRQELKLDYNKDDIISKKLDYIYMEIINSLIKNNKFANLSFCEEKLNELEFKDIIITNTIISGLFKLFNETNENMNEYMFEDISDLNNEKKIYFYYLLFEYIFQKDSFYIYNNDFLKKNYRKLCKLIKEKIEKKIDYLVKKFYSDKMEDILSKINKKLKEDFINSNNSYNNNDNNQSNNSNNKNDNNNGNNNSCNYSNYNNNDDKNNNNNNDSRQNDEKSQNDYTSKSFRQEEKNEFAEIQSNSLIFTTGALNDNDYMDYDEVDDILKEVTIKIKINSEVHVSGFYEKEIFYGKDKTKLLSGYFKDKIKPYNSGSKVLESKYNITCKNYIRFLSFIKEIEVNLTKANIKIKPQIILEITRKNDKTNEDGFYNLNCISTFYNQKISLNEAENKMEFIDRNILVKSINGNPEGLLYLINELTNDDYKGAKFNYIHDEKTKLESTNMAV